MLWSEMGAVKLARAAGKGFGPLAPAQIRRAAKYGLWLTVPVQLSMANLLASKGPFP